MKQDITRFAAYPAAIALLAFAACTPVAYLPGAQVVTVGAREHTVRRSGDGYVAQINNTVFGGDPSESDIYVGNLRAIRDVTGCPVAVPSVVNEDGQTTARLACPANQRPNL